LVPCCDWWDIPQLRGTIHYQTGIVLAQALGVPPWMPGHAGSPESMTLWLHILMRKGYRV